MSADKKKRGSKNFQVSSAGSLGKAPGVGYLGSVSGCPEVDGEKKKQKKTPQNRPTVTAQQFSLFFIRILLIQRRYFWNFLAQETSIDH